MSKNIIAIHKQVAKKLEFKKIENAPEEFEKILGGKIEILSFKEFEDVLFICRKYRERLRPNIYINITFGKLDETIRGDLIVVGKDFKSLTREQALKYGELIERESYNYSHFDQNGKYITNKQLNKKSMKNNKKHYGEFIVESAYKQKETKTESTEVLSMILKMQAVILQFIKNNSQ